MFLTLSAATGHSALAKHTRWLHQRSPCKPVAPLLSALMFVVSAVSITPDCFVVAGYLLKLL